MDQQYSLFLAIEFWHNGIRGVLQELHHMKQVLVGVARKGRPLLSCDQESSLHIPPPTLFVSVGFSVCIGSAS
jgi:hypothetical protein